MNDLKIKCSPVIGNYIMRHFDNYHYWIKEQRRVAGNKWRGVFELVIVSEGKNTIFTGKDDTILSCNTVIKNQEIWQDTIKMLRDILKNNKSINDFVNLKNNKKISDFLKPIPRFYNDEKDFRYVRDQNIFKIFLDDCLLDSGVRPVYIDYNFNSDFISDSWLKEKTSENNKIFQSLVKTSINRKVKFIDVLMHDNNLFRSAWTTVTKTERKFINDLLKTNKEQRLKKGLSRPADDEVKSNSDEEHKYETAEDYLMNPIESKVLDQAIYNMTKDMNTAFNDQEIILDVGDYSIYNFCEMSNDDFNEDQSEDKEDETGVLNKENGLMGTINNIIEDVTNNMEQTILKKPLNKENIIKINPEYLIKMCIIRRLTLRTDVTIETCKRLNRIKQSVLGKSREDNKTALKIYSLILFLLQEGAKLEVEDLKDSGSFEVDSDSKCMMLEVDEEQKNAEDDYDEW